MIGRIASLASRLSGLRGWRADLAATLYGMVSALALPPIFAVPLLLIGIPGLLSQIGAARGMFEAARRGFWFGFGLHVVGLYWITEAILFEAERFWWLVPLAVPGLAAVVSLLYTAIPAAVVWRAPRGWRAALTLAGAWVLAELARQFVATGFPWNPLGSVWELPGRLGDIMIQPAAMVGVHGLTFATVLLAATPLLTWVWRLSGLLALTLWFGYGIVRLGEPVPPAPDLTVLLVQGNVAQGQKWDRALMIQIFHRYLDLTREAVTQVDGPALVVWPETASPAQLETDAEARELISQSAKGATALVGAVRFDQADRPRNSLFALASNGRIEAIYDKWHLVPFGEYQPDWVPLGLELIPGRGFASGPGPRTLRLPGVPPVGALICYEAIFSHEVIDESNRPDWMINVTNDAWFGNSTGPRQHLAAARLRAVEEGLPLLRAANTGISAAFDAKGQELGRLEMQTTGVLSVRLPGPLAITWYARIGLLLPGGLGIVAMMGGLLSNFTRLRRARANF